MPTGDEGRQPVIFGEVLFDVFPGDQAVLGGAPLNVAWHLQGLGLTPLLISRVGDDARGREVLAAMEQWGLDRSGVQVDTERPTGEVHIQFKDGTHSFDILPNQAYDYIDRQAAQELLTHTPPSSLFYHGTLCARSEVSAGALMGLRRQLPNRFVDINLRAPWWSAAEVLRLAEGTPWFKLNDEELFALAGRGDLPVVAERFRRQHGIDWLLLTRGGAGAVLLTAEQTLQHAAPQPPVMVDTVGAGDAFSAVTLLGIATGWPPATILQRALQFASAVCTLRGAVTYDRDFYRQFTEDWQSPA